VLAGLVATILLVATACVAPEPDRFEGTGPIVFVDGPDTSLHRQIAHLADAWNKVHAYSERVSFVEMPYSTDDHRAQLRARAQDLADADREKYASQCYDVMAMDVVWTAEFAEAGYLVPLDPADFGVDAMLAKPVQAVTLNGQLWAVPMRTDVGLLYYRTDLVSSPPRTWPELVDAARTVGPARDMFGYVGQFNQYEGLTVNAVEAIGAKGGAVLDDKGRVVVDSAPARAGVRMLADGVADGWIPREALRFDEERSREAFQQGHAVFLRNWPYVYSQLADPDSPVVGKFGVAPMPGGGVLGGWNLGVSTCSTHRKTARDFIRFVAGEQNQRTLFERAGFAPSIASLYDDPRLRRDFPYLGVLKAALRDARIRPTTPYYDDVSSAIQEYVSNALTHPVSADVMMGYLAARLRDIVGNGP
jgi:multiple sugar transport system substrate-binding protein